jgi:2-alkenal reductase
VFFLMKKAVILITLAVLLVATLSCQSLPFTSNQKSLNAAKTTVSPLKQTDQDSSAQINQTNSADVLVDLYKKVNPGVVSIQTLSDQGEGLGSGFVYDLNGNILTNYHVVENATQLEVDFPSGYKAMGKVVATDLDSDLAIVNVKVPVSELHPLPLGDSDLIQVGQRVIALGNPFGLNGTLTEGIISAKGRTLDSIHQAPGGDYFTSGDILQTDAAINPGNSGGPLLNLAGEVIGINRSIRTTDVNSVGEPLNSGIGFAVSVNVIRRVAPVLIEKGKYEYPYIGITSQQALNLPELEALGITQMTGAYVFNVAAGGPAEAAGIRGGSKSTSIVGLKSGGDLIIAVDHQPVQVFADLLSYLVSHKSPGDQVVITVLRDSVEKDIVVTLGKRP